MKAVAILASHVVGASATNMKANTREICLYGIFGAITFILKLVMAPLPNIEPVSLLLIAYTITFGIKVIYPLAIYVLLEIIIYGFGIWSVGYLYIWLVLVVTVLSIYNITQSTNALLWAIISGIFGFLIGVLYIPLYVITGGTTMAFNWWLAGFPYDAVHGVANFVICLVMIKPLTKLLFMLNKQYKIND